MQRDKCGLRVKTEVAAQLQAAHVLVCVDEQADRHQQSPQWKLLAREKGPLVAGNFLKQALHLNAGRHR